MLVYQRVNKYLLRYCGCQVKVPNKHQAVDIPQEIRMETRYP